MSWRGEVWRAWSAAATLAERGHRVILHEKSGELGGQWLAASAGEDKRPFRTLTAGLVRRMEKAGVDIRLNSCALDKNAILSEKPDVVILATGAHPRDLSGVDILPSPEQNGIARLFRHRRAARRARARQEGP